MLEPMSAHCECDARAPTATSVMQMGTDGECGRREGRLQDCVLMMQRHGQNHSECALHSGWDRGRATVVVAVHVWRQCGCRRTARQARWKRNALGNAY